MRMRCRAGIVSVADLAPELQMKLHRLLRDGEIERVGSHTPIKVSVRIIALTTHTLEELRASASFDDDLYWRLTVFPIHVPPLRTRKEEVTTPRAEGSERRAALSQSSTRRWSGTHRR